MRLQYPCTVHYLSGFPRRAPNFLGVFSVEIHEITQKAATSKDSNSHSDQKDTFICEETAQDYPPTQLFTTQLLVDLNGLNEF